jgi:3-dehydrosphinganine reductase
MSAETYGGAFEGRHALVTGGSMGIGLAIAQRLVRAGASVTLIARRAGPLEEARTRLLADTPSASVHTVVLDVAERTEVARVLGPEMDARPIDLLFNNAAISRPGRFLEMDPDAFRSHVDVNYLGTVWMCRVVVPRMVSRRSGRVVNVGSLLSVMGLYGNAAYVGPKFALYGLSEVLRAELKEHGVRVTVVLPPAVDTPMLAAEQDWLPAETRALYAGSRTLSADEVAHACLGGVARGQFEVVPGLDSRLSVLANRIAPSVVRAYVEWVASRARSGA